MIGLRGRLPFRRNYQDRKDSIQRCSWPEILIALALFEHTLISGLMAGHANVVRHIDAQLGGIDNEVALVLLDRITRTHCVDVRRSRPVTVFAANRHLCKRRVFKASIGRWDRSGPTAVTRDAACQDRTDEAVIPEFIPRRRTPGARIA